MPFCPVNPVVCVFFFFFFLVTLRLKKKKKKISLFFFFFNSLFQEEEEEKKKPMSDPFANDKPLGNYESVFKDDALLNKFAFVTGLAFFFFFFFFFFDNCVLIIFAKRKGGGSGINFRITEALMRHGCDVAIASRNIKRVETASKRLCAAYPNRKCVYFQMDITKPTQISNTVESVLRVFPRIDILVNGAAGNFLSFAEDLSVNGFEKVFKIDTFGTFHTSCEVFRQSMKKNKSGVILNITATLDFSGTMMQAHAGSAKAAINAMTRHLAVEWGDHNVRVLSVAPGPIAGTVGLEKLGGFLIRNKSIPNYLGSSMGVPLQRFGERKEIADVCVFLASNAASYMTGACVVVDGGHWMLSSQTMGLLAKSNPAIKAMILQHKVQHHKKKESKL